MSDPLTPTTSHAPDGDLDDGSNSYMRWAKKAWNPLGLYTRDEAIQLLRDKVVSQKRRMLMKDCVRIIYYCQVQRSNNCRYEMSVCVPLNNEEKLRIDDYNMHSCDLDATRQKRRVLPQLEDFDRPIEKRQRYDRPPKRPAAQDKMGEEEEGIFQDHDPVYATLNGVGHHVVEEETSSGFNEIARTWTTVDVDVVDLTKKPDGSFKFLVNCTDQTTNFSYAAPLTDISSDSLSHALLDIIYTFGPPDEFQLEAVYMDFRLVDAIKKRFPMVTITAFTTKKNNKGLPVPRRQAQIVKERLFAWLVENDCSNWSRELKVMKYSHNSEWIEELGGTPMDLFYRRTPSKGYIKGIEGDQLLHDVKFEMCNG